jgi:hypothetical protein
MVTVTKHLCVKYMRTIRANVIKDLWERSQYGALRKGLEYFTQHEICLQCGFPLDNSDPHPYSRGYWYWRDKVRTALESDLSDTEVIDLMDEEVQRHRHGRVSIKLTPPDA